jgi:hypothetical protein
MKRKLLAMSIAASFALPGATVAPVAMADVTLSGAINMGPLFGRSKDGAAAGPTNDVTGVNPSQPQGVSGAFLHSTYSLINVT